VLAVDLAEVGHEEGILLAGLAQLGVNALDAVAESVTDELAGGGLLRQLLLLLRVDVASVVIADGGYMVFDGCFAEAMSFDV
jgi:hypothetical protein